MKYWNYPISTKDCNHPGSTLSDNTTVYSSHDFKTFSSDLNSEGFSITSLWKKIYNGRGNINLWIGLKKPQTPKM